MTSRRFPAAHAANPQAQMVVSMPVMKATWRAGFQLSAFMPAIAPPYSPQQQMQGVPLPPVAETTSVSKPLQLVPNPASEEVNVHLPQAEGEWELQLWDINGRLARSWQIQGETAPTLNLQGLPKGLYVLHGLSPDGQPYQSKLVVE